MDLEHDLPPWLKRVLIGIGTPVGLTRHNWTLTEVMSRPWWFYRARGRIPNYPIKRRTPRRVTDADVELCRRLLSAFALATSDGHAQGEARPGIWSWILSTHQRELAQALADGDPGDLARLLASMFQKEFVWGIAHGGHVRDSASWLGARILNLNSLDLLVSLAEALGVSPVENPEQGRAGVAFSEGIVDLVARIDRAIGFRIDAPNVGAPFGLAVEDRLITLEAPEQIYTAGRIDQAICTHLHSLTGDAPALVEIGGGYGGLCYWLLRTRPDVTRYTIVDLPIMGVLQGYFLAQALGSDAVSFLGEPPALVTLVPDSALAEVQVPFQVLVNQDSMPEMPHETMLSYLEWGREHCHGFFYSYNQETTADFLGQTQGLVPTAMDRLGGFRRVRRDRSWLRRGYAEEIYIPSDSSCASGVAPAVHRATATTGM